MQKSERGTRNRLIEAALYLFRRHRYQGTSVERILEAAEANSGSVYDYFATKEELLPAVLDRYFARLRPIVMGRPFERSTDPIDRVFEVLGDYRERVRRSQFTHTCLGSLALEVGEISRRARVKISRNFAAWCAAITECFEAAGDRLPADIDRAEPATFVSVMEGAVMQAKAHHNLHAFDASLRQLHRFVLSLDPTTSGSRSSAALRDEILSADHRNV